MSIQYDYMSILDRAKCFDNLKHEFLKKGIKNDLYINLIDCGICEFVDNSTVSGYDPNIMYINRINYICRNITKKWLDKLYEKSPKYLIEIATYPSWIFNPTTWQSFIEKEAMENALRESKTTDRHVCGKCKQRRTVEISKQTRSIDESDTLIVKCVGCGHRWRM